MTPPPDTRQDTRPDPEPFNLDAAESRIKAYIAVARLADFHGAGDLDIEYALPVLADAEAVLEHARKLEAEVERLRGVISKVSFCWNMGEIKQICAEALPDPVAAPEERKVP